MQETSFLTEQVRLFFQSFNRSYEKISELCIQPQNLCWKLLAGHATINPQKAKFFAYSDTLETSSSMQWIQPNIIIYEPNLLGIQMVVKSANLLHNEPTKSIPFLNWFYLIKVFGGR